MYVTHPLLGFGHLEVEQDAQVPPSESSQSGVGRVEGVVTKATWYNKAL